MNAKQRPDGSPNVIYLEEELVRRFGEGFRVILPITDPSWRTTALGSFAQVHLPPGLEPSRVRDWLLSRPGVTECHLRPVAARLMELPEDRMGDLVVASGRDVVLGRTPAYHDLSALAGNLRSHGGRYEEMVPLVFSQRLSDSYAQRAAATYATLMYSNSPATDCLDLRPPALSAVASTVLNRTGPFLPC